MPRLASTAVAFLVLALAAAKEPTAPPKDTLPAQLSIEAIPRGLEPRIVPKDNPLTAASVALGRKLFFDPILSADQTIACASCHDPAHGFASATGRPRGIRSQLLERRAPSLLNRAYGSAFFWDGRARSLEEQALQPIENPAEMGSGVAEALQRLEASDAYQAQFKAAYPGGISAANLAKALASFERVLLRGDSAVDRFRRLGEHAALTPLERHGLWLYESKARCWRCHSGANFTDEGFHNTGVSWGQGDLGRSTVTKNDADRGKFKTPSLRGVTLTSPYMHDGSLKRLEDVIDFYNRGGGPNPRLDPIIGPLQLSTEEVQALVAFLKAL